MTRRHALQHEILPVQRGIHDAAMKYTAVAISDVIGAESLKLRDALNDLLLP